MDSKFIITLLSAVFMVLVLSITPAGAEEIQTNFTISPPPLGFPEFSDELFFTHEVRMLGGSVKGDNIDLWGAGVAWLPRVSVNSAAADMLLGFHTMTGTVGTGAGKTDMIFYGIDLAPNIELLALDFSRFKMIIAAGYSVTMNRGSYVIEDFTFDAINYYDVTVFLDTVMYGPVATLQASIILAGDFMISPFVMLARSSGKTTVSADPNFELFNSEYDVPAFTTLTYGFDILYLPAGITLSGMLQMLGKSGDRGEIRTTTFGAGFKF